MSWRLARARIFRNRFNFATRAFATSLALIAILSIQAIAISSAHSQAKYTLAKLPDGDQTITLASSSAIFSADTRTKISNAVSLGLSGLVAPEIRREVLFHELSDLHGTGFYFGGLDSLASKATLLSGRFPKSCTPIRCEVIQILNGSNSVAYLGNLKLVVVGQAQLIDKFVFSGTYAPEPNISLFLTDGVSPALSRGADFNLQGSNGWIAEINAADIGHEGVTKYIKSILAFENGISSDFSRLSLTWPIDTLSAAETESAEVAKKIGSLTQVVTALFLIFLVLFSQRQKKRDKEFRSGLGRIGAPKKLILLATALESAAPLFSGYILALVMAPLVKPLLSVFGFEVNFGQILASEGKQLILLVLASFLTIATTLQGDFEWKFENRWLIFSTLAAFSLLVILNAQVFGNQNLGGWLAPIALALAITQSSYYLFDRLSSFWRTRNQSKFLIARENLGNWKTLTAILAAAFLLAIASISYISGVDQEIGLKTSDQVPLDFRLVTGPNLTRPLDVAEISDYEKLGSNSFAYPVLRIGSSVRGSSQVADSISILGLPAPALSHLQEKPLRSLSAAIAPTSLPVEVGIPMGSAQVLSIDTKNIPAVIDLVAWFLTPQDQHLSLTSTDHSNLRKIHLFNNLPIGSKLVALELRETSEYISRRLHALGEGKFAVPLISGVGSIKELLLDGKKVSFPKEIWGFNNFKYSFDGASMLLRPPTKVEIPRVITDPTTASLADKGFLALSTSAESSFRVKISAVQKFFPTAGDRFVVMDLSLLRQEVSKNQIGASDPIEVWVATSDPKLFSSALASRKFKEVKTMNRSADKNELRADPVNKGLKAAYLFALFYALCLALAMHLSAIPLIFRERISLLEYMEMHGTPPDSIMAALRSNIRVVVAVAVAAGFLVGIPLSAALISNSIPYLHVVEIALLAIATTEVIAISTTLRRKP